MSYPPGWPRCPSCGDFALDGKATCGRATCATRSRIWETVTPEPAERAYAHEIVRSLRSVPHAEQVEFVAKALSVARLRTIRHLARYDAQLIEQSQRLAAAADAEDAQEVAAATAQLITVGRRLNSRSFEELLERSSLGSREVKAASERTPDSVVQEILRRANLRRADSPRANYKVERYENVLVVYDLGGPYPSVTNDAERVVEDLAREHDLKPPVRVIYRDSDGYFDELLVSADGQFEAFAPIGETDLERAIAVSRHRTKGGVP